MIVLESCFDNLMGNRSQVCSDPNSEENKILLDTGNYMPQNHLSNNIN